jgi:hypothetical protein
MNRETKREIAPSQGKTCRWASPFPLTSKSKDTNLQTNLILFYNSTILQFYNSTILQFYNSPSTQHHRATAHLSATMQPRDTLNSAFLKGIVRPESTAKSIPLLNLSC